jgi:hypothetical protein
MGGGSTSRANGTSAETFAAALDSNVSDRESAEQTEQIGNAAMGPGQQLEALHQGEVSYVSSSSI